MLSYFESRGTITENKIFFPVAYGVLFMYEGINVTFRYILLHPIVFCIDMFTFFCNVGDLAPVVKLVDKQTILKERAAKLEVSVLKKNISVLFAFCKFYYSHHQK